MDLNPYVLSYMPRFAQRDITRKARSDIARYAHSDIIFASETREANITRRKPNITAKQ